jgi:predicted unusual protein kinase regulating ubiquinone biosynthesis (AarF/ABC1/UbiB family)
VNADLHQRTADRISSLIKANGGLYIKIGQLLGHPTYPLGMNRYVPG